MTSELNFKLINIRDGLNTDYLFYDLDKCLYKKNGKRKDVQYYICSDKSDNKNCSVTGKLVNGVFSTIKQINKHNHPNHEQSAEIQSYYNTLKEVVKNSNESVEKILTESAKK